MSEGKTGREESEDPKASNVQGFALHPGRDFLSSFKQKAGEPTAVTPIQNVCVSLPVTPPTWRKGQHLSQVLSVESKTVWKAP